MEILLVMIIVLLLGLVASVGYLFWITLNKPEPIKTNTTPEKAFEEFKKLIGDTDPESKFRLEQIQKCIYYSPEREGDNQWKARN